jgi:CubicO group peptidase (beta-lactamase class C family)
MQRKRCHVLGTVLSTLLLGVLGCSLATSAQGGADPIWPTREWKTSTAEEQGMDSAALASLIEFGTRYSLDSLLIARHGIIVLDAYYTPYYTAKDPHIMYSATKAVIGTLTAIALKDGLLDSTDHRMLAFFGDRSIANVDDRKKAITVQNLLDMTSGIDWNEPLTGVPVSIHAMVRSPDAIKFVLDRPMANAPGDVFSYNSGNPHLLSAILTKLTGMSAEEYGRAKLFGPLGITINPSDWGHDGQDLTTGWIGLALRPRDMAKIGYLYLRNGIWEDEALLPPAWIERISHATLNMNLKNEPNLRYANFFWALPDKHVYMANGFDCQLIMVFPETDIVAVTTARDFCPLGKLADYISGAVKSGSALPPNPAGADLLAAAILALPTGQPTR